MLRTIASTRIHASIPGLILILAASAARAVAIGATMHFSNRL